MPPTPAPNFDLVRTRLAQARKSQGLSLRAAADEARVSAATLSRFESKKGNPDLDTLSKLVLWLELDRSAVFRTAVEEDMAELDTPQKVAVHLRADPKLDQRTAQALAKGFQALYEQFTDDDAPRPIRRDL